MSTYTKNLNLFKYDVTADEKVPFSITDALNNNWDIIDAKCTGGGLEVCDIGMALYVDETKGLRRYLNGQVIDINENTQAFLNRLLQIKTTNPDYFTTEDNWQAEALLNIDGCVYKFVLNYSGADVVSVRLPKYPDYVEITDDKLAVVGNGMVLGLTDGNNNYGLIQAQSSSASVLEGRTHVFGVNVGDSYVSGGVVNKSAYIGITTDPTKSGMETTGDITKLKLKYFIQIATGSETENHIINDIELNNPYSLFDSKYSDHELNNLSWLKSEGQWNAKAVYPTAYDKLLKVYNGTETVEGLSVKLSTEEYTDYDFVLNTVNETFRLPLKTKLASGNAVIGNGMTLGFTNGSVNFGQYDFYGTNSSSYQSLYGADVGSTTFTSRVNSGSGIGITSDPTKSGIELSDNGLYLYYYVGETVQNANLIDAGRIGEQLATKTDMLQASGAGMPSDKYIDLTLGASGSTYTAPANGYAVLSARLSGGIYITIYNTNTQVGGSVMFPSGTGYIQGYVFAPCQKGETFEIMHKNPTTNIVFRFVYAEGEV